MEGIKYERNFNDRSRVIIKNAKGDNYLKMITA